MATSHGTQLHDDDVEEAMINNVDHAISTQRNKDERNQSATPVDGKWAVVVAIAAFIGRIILACQTSSMPFLTTEWEGRLGVTPSQVSWASTLVTGLRFATAPFAGALNHHWGSRPVVFAGGVIGCLAMIAMSAGRELWQIYLCCVIIGVASGMVYQGAVIIVNQYFEKRLGRANGFAFGGVGVGIMIASPIMTLLIENFTWRGAQLLMAGFFANCCVVATIFRPLSWWSSPGSSSSSQNRVDGNTKTIPLADLHSAPENRREDVNGTILSKERDGARYEENIPNGNGLTRQDGCSESLLQETVSVEVVESNTNRSDNESDKGAGFCAKRCGVLKRVIDLLGVSLLWTNTNVLLLCIMSFFNGGAYFPSYVYLASYAQASGSSELKASFIFTIIGICSLAARFLHGFLIDYHLISAVRLYAVSSFIAAIACYVIVFSAFYQAFVGFAVIFGISTGTLASLSPIITKEYTEKKELASAFALECLFLGLGQFAGVYLQGVLYDATTAYLYCFCVSGALFILSGLVAAVIEAWNLWKKRSRP